MNTKGTALIVFRMEPTGEEIKAAEKALLNISSELSVLHIKEYNDFGIYFDLITDADEQAVYKDLVSILHACSEVNCHINGYVIFCDEEKFELTKFRQNKYHRELCSARYEEGMDTLA